MTDTPLPIPDACIRLGKIHRATLYREVRDGKLRITKIRGGSFIMESEIVRYLRDRQPKRKRAA